MRKWLHDGAPNVFWFGGFFFPQGFMTATKQNFARKYSQPIDALGFDFKVLNGTAVEEVTEPADDGVFTGMYFDGAVGTTRAALSQTHALQRIGRQCASCSSCLKWTTRLITPSLHAPCTRRARDLDSFHDRYVYKFCSNGATVRPGGAAPEWVLAGVGCVLNLND